MPAKVLVIGLDAATLDLIESWVAEGHLPAFRHLLEKGCRARPWAVVPCLTSPAIPTLYTGRNPAKLGIVGWRKPDGSIVHSGDVEGPAVWDILTAQGFKSCIAGLGVTYPPRPIKGILLSGSVPSEDSNYIYPSELKAKVAGFHSEKFIIDRLEAEDPQTSKKEIVELATRLVKKKWRIFKDLVASDDFDLAWLWLIMTDDIQHFYWNDKGLMLTFWQEIDGIVQEALATLAGADLLVVSDHGCENGPAFNFHINSWLRDRGYLRLKSGQARRAMYYGAQKLMRNYIKRLLPSETALQLLDLFERFTRGDDRLSSSAAVADSKRLFNTNRSFLWGVDWKRTLAYTDITPWGIRLLNIEADRYEAVRGQLIEDLRNFRDKQGQKVIRGAWKREEIFSGKYLPQFPDIIFLVREGYQVDRFLSPEIITPVTNVAKQRGAHFNALEATLIAYGPSFKEGVYLEDQIKTVDVVPTILHLIGAKLPRDLDGKVLRQIFRPGSIAASREVKYLESSSLDMGEKGQTGITEEEEALLRQRLHNLGYIS